MLHPTRTVHSVLPGQRPLPAVDHCQRRRGRGATQKKPFDRSVGGRRGASNAASHSRTGWNGSSDLENSMHCSHHEHPEGQLRSGSLLLFSFRLTQGCIPIMLLLRHIATEVPPPMYVCPRRVHMDHSS